VGVLNFDNFDGENDDLSVNLCGQNTNCQFGAACLNGFVGIGANTDFHLIASSPTTLILTAADSIYFECPVFIVTIQATFVSNITQNATLLALNVCNFVITLQLPLSAVSQTLTLANVPFCVQSIIYDLLLNQKLTSALCTYSATPSTNGMLSFLQTIVANELNQTNNFGVAGVTGGGTMGRAFNSNDLKQTYTMAMLNYCGDSSSNMAPTNVSGAHYTPANGVFSSTCTNGPTPATNLTRIQMWNACDGFAKFFNMREIFGE